MHYLAGNLWLVVALFLIVGRTPMPFSNGMYSFFGHGAWLDTNTYGGLIAFAFGAAGVSFVLAFLNRNKKAATS